MKQSKQLIFGAAIVVALLAGTFVLVIVPANRKRDALQEDSERKLAAIARFNELAAESTGVQAKIGEVRQAIAQFETRLPAARQMNRVEEDIWHLAQANSLQTRTLKTSAGKRIGSYFAQDMDFALAGNFSAFYQFMLQIEQLPSAVRVEKITLNRVGRDGEMQVDMTLCVLLQPEPSAAPGAMANISIDQR